MVDEPNINMLVVLICSFVILGNMTSLVFVDTAVFALKHNASVTSAATTPAHSETQNTDILYIHIA